MGARRGSGIHAVSAGRIGVALTTSLVTIAALAAPAAAKGPKIVPSSNLAIGRGTYAARISAPPGTLPPVPNPSGGVTGASITATTGSARITSAPGTFGTTTIGSFVDDGAGGLLPDGSDAVPLNANFAAYPRQGLARIKAVATDGSSATITMPAIGTGSGGAYVVEPVAAIAVLIQGVGGLPYLVDVFTPVTGGLCLTPLFASTNCDYDSGNLQWQASVVLATAGLDGSLPATSFTIREGTADGLLGATVPGPMWVRYFDPDASGPAPLAPWAVPPGTQDATERGCRPDIYDRLIPNAGGVDYCVVNVVAVNAGKSTQGYGKPFSYYALPLTWAAQLFAQVQGSDLHVGGFEFANDDVIMKLIIKNSKATITGTTTPCPALNRVVTSAGVGPADQVGNFDYYVTDYANGCTVPAGSVTKITALGSKDVQQSQIPGEPALGTNLPRKASYALVMP